MSALPSTSPLWRIETVISGGQTGVDRAALDVALELGMSCGGWCPKGRLAEDGPIDVKYPLTETSTAKYAERTERNVIDSEGTLILACHRRLSGGTALTQSFARRNKRPCLVIDPREPESIANVLDWLTANSIRVLNVAGPRESSQPGITQHAIRFLRELWTQAKPPFSRRKPRQMALKKLATASMTESNVSK